MAPSEYKTILLTGGRAPHTLALARQFHAAGHRVLVAESVPRHLCRTSRAVARNFEVPAPNGDPGGFIAGLAAILAEEAVDLLIPTCEEVFHVSRGLETLSAHATVFCPPLDTLRRLHSKWEFIQRLKGLGIAVPDTWRLKSRSELTDLLGELPVGYRLVLKPEYSRFAANVHFVAAGDEAPPLDISPVQTWVAQAFVAGRALCSYSVARNGVLSAHADYQADFTAGIGACINFRPLHHAGVRAWVAALAQAEGFTGQIAFDFIETADGQLLPLECNPRATSGIYLFSGASLPEAFWRTGESPVLPRAGDSAMVGLAMLLYGLRGVRNFSRLAQWGRTVASSRDVVLDWRDPAPFFHQFVSYADFVRLGRRAGLTPLEASTRDIEWNGAD